MMKIVVVDASTVPIQGLKTLLVAFHASLMGRSDKNQIGAALVFVSADFNTKDGPCEWLRSQGIYCINIKENFATDTAPFFKSYDYVEIVKVGLDGETVPK